MGVFSDVWPVFLRRHDVSTTAIGLLSALSWAWSLKMLWSPLVDRYGDARHWIAAALCTMAAALGLLGTVDAGALGPALLALLALYCLASATQDIAIDGYTIGLTPHGAEGPVTSMRVAAYRVGTLAAGTGLLFLPRQIGWDGTFAAAALASLAMALAVLACPRVGRAPGERRALLPALRRWLEQPGVAGGARLHPALPRRRPRDGPDGEALLGGRRLQRRAEIGRLRSARSARDAVGRRGRRRRGGAPRHPARAARGSASWRWPRTSPTRWPRCRRRRLAGVVAASLVESLCSGLAGVGFLSFLMRITDREHAAAHYAVLTRSTPSRRIVSAPSGWLVEQLGYAPYFALTAFSPCPPSPSCRRRGAGCRGRQRAQRVLRTGFGGSAPDRWIQSSGTPASFASTSSSSSRRSARSTSSRWRRISWRSGRTSGSSRRTGRPARARGRHLPGIRPLSELGHVLLGLVERVLGGLQVAAGGGEALLPLLT